MEIALIGYFDAGITVGYDDTAFIKGKAADRLTAEAYRFQGNNRLGNGIRLDLTGDKDLLRLWREDARTVATSESFRQQFPYNDTAGEQLRQLLDSEELRYGVSVIVHCCGICTVELNIDALDDAIQGVDAVRLALMFEFAAYGYYGSKASFHTIMLKAARQELEQFAFDENRSLREIMFRDVLRKPADKFIPSFTLVFFNRRNGFREEMKTYCTEYGCEDTDIRLNGLEATGSWYIWAASFDRSSGDSLSHDQLISALKLYTLYFGASECCENRLVALISDSMWRPGSISKHKTMELQTIGNVVINNTNLQVSTQNGEFKLIFRIMEKMGDLDAFRNAIIRSVEVIADIEQQLEHHEEKRRDMRINFFVASITSLTFISVIADLLDLDQHACKLIATSWARWALYVAFLCGIVFAIYRLFKSSARKAADTK